jgi:hypothetical protein
MTGGLARLTAVTVTVIVVFGTDGDVLRAVPLGVFAAVLSSLIVALADTMEPARARAR